jgi:tetratricopeptide (TPR) repeat protein
MSADPLPLGAYDLTVDSETARAFIYFLVVKWPQYWPHVKRLIRTQPLSSEKLIRRYEATPSEANELALANAFYDEERFEQAGKLYQDVLQKQPEHSSAMRGLARVYRTQENHGECVSLYEKLVALDPRQDDFRVALEYGESLWESGAQARALEVLEDLAGETQRLNHQLAFAHYLHRANQKKRAREVVEDALQSHVSLPVWQQRKDKRWVRSAHQLLAELDEDEERDE